MCVTNLLSVAKDSTNKFYLNPHALYVDSGENHLVRIESAKSAHMEKKSVVIELYLRRENRANETRCNYT